MAGPLRGGGGKDLAIKEKITFLKTFILFCCHLKIVVILLKTTYRNMDIITSKFVGRYFYWVVTIFSKNRAILVQKLGEEKNCQNPFLAIFERKKNPTAIKLGGGDKALKNRLLLSGDSKSLDIGYCYTIDAHHLKLLCHNW